MFILVTICTILCALFWIACTRWSAYAYRGERHLKRSQGSSFWIWVVGGSALMAGDQLMTLIPSVEMSPLIDQIRLVILAAMLAVMMSRMRFHEAASDRAQFGFACWLVSLLIADPQVVMGWKLLLGRFLQVAGTLALIASIRVYLTELFRGSKQEIRSIPSLRTSVSSLVLVLGFMLLTWTGMTRAVASAETIDSAQGRALWFEDLTTVPDEKTIDTIGAALRASVVTGKPVDSIDDSRSHPVAFFITPAGGQTRWIIARDVRTSIEKAIGVIGSKATTGFRIDFVGAMTRVEFGEGDLDPDQDPVVPDFRRGIHGIAFQHPWRIAISPGQVLASGLVDKGRRFDRDVFRTFTSKGNESHVEAIAAVDSGMFDIYRFETTSRYYSANESVDLVRGHAMFETLQSKELLESAISGAEYLSRSVDESGEFAYSYDAVSDRVADRYNMLRHAGSIYSMLEVYEVHKDPLLLAAIQRALEYMDERIGIYPHDDEGETDVLVDGGDSIKVGGNALAAIAISKYVKVTGDDGGVDTLKRLSRWLVHHVGEDGRFPFHKQSYETGSESDFVSEYYPGEALLALVRTHGVDPSDRWLDAAERIATHLIDIRDRHRSDEELPHDHWLLYGLNELHRHRPDPRYLAHARRIVDAIVSRQRVDPRVRDWVGSYYRPPRSTPTATRSEGLAAAYFLEKDHGSAERARTILESIQRGVSFQLQTQIRPESSFHLADPARARGGFRRSLEEFEIRIDYVQHNISSLLLLRRILLSES